MCPTCKLPGRLHCTHTSCHWWVCDKCKTIWCGETGRSYKPVPVTDKRSTQEKK